MPSPNAQAGRAPWIALAAVAALAAGVVVAWQQSRPPRPPGPVVVEEPAAGAVDEALRHAAPIDSTEFKQRWLDDVRGLDISGLDARRRVLFLRMANAQQCTCGCGYTLAGCRASDMTCDVSGPRLAAMLDSVRAGQITRVRGIRERPRDGG